jgi:hypothetical protein
MIKAIVLMGNPSLLVVAVSDSFVRPLPLPAGRLLRGIGISCGAGIDESDVCRKSPGAL